MQRKDILGRITKAFNASDMAAVVNSAFDIKDAIAATSTQLARDRSLSAKARVTALRDRAKGSLLTQLATAERRIQTAKDAAKRESVARKLGRAQIEEVEENIALAEAAIGILRVDLQRASGLTSSGLQLAISDAVAASRQAAIA